MVALGAVVKATGIVPLDAVKKAMGEMLGKKSGGKIVKVNEQALDAGYNAV